MNKHDGPHTPTLIYLTPRALLFLFLPSSPPPFAPEAPADHLDCSLWHQSKDRLCPGRQMRSRAP